MKPRVSIAAKAVASHTESDNAATSRISMASSTASNAPSAPVGKESSWRRRALQRQQYLAQSIEQRSSSAQNSLASLSADSASEGGLGLQNHVTLENALLASVSTTSSQDDSSNTLTSPTAAATRDSSTRSQSPQPSPLSSPPTDFYSKHSTSDVSGFTLEGSTNTADENNWSTCSSLACDDSSPSMSLFVPLTNVNHALAANSAAPRQPKVARANVATMTKNEEVTSKKGKKFHSMLSAVNRKRSKALPPEAAPSCNNFPKPEEVAANGLAISTIPSGSSPSMTQMDLTCDANKPQPRSGRIESSENHVALCALLNDDETAVRESVQAQIEPKSEFEWDDEDDDTVPQAGRFNNLLPFKRSRRAVSSNDAEQNAQTLQEKEARIINFVNLNTIRFRGSPNAFKDKHDSFNDAETGGESEEDPHHVQMCSPAQITQISRNASMVKRSSVLKHFDDPIWGGESVTGYNFNEREFSDPTLGQDYTRPNVPPTTTRPTGLSTSTSMPSLTAVVKEQSRSGACDDIKISPTKCDDQNMAEAQVLLGCSSLLAGSRPVQHTLTRQRDYDVSPTKGSSKSRSIVPGRKPKSQLSVATDSVSSARQYKPSSPPIKQRQGASTPTSAPVCRTPKTPSGLRHELTAAKKADEDMFDPFLDSRTRSTTGESHSFSDASTLVNAKQHESPMASLAPTESSTWTVIHSPAFDSDDVLLSPGIAFHQHVNEAQNVANPVAGKCLASQAPYRSSMQRTSEDLRLSNIKTARDIILRASELNVSPKKEVSAMTAEDFQAMGEVVTSALENASIHEVSRTFHYFFAGDVDAADRPPVGTRAEHIHRQLREHHALRFLNGTGSLTTRSIISQEQRAMCYEALKIFAEQGDKTLQQSFPENNEIASVGLGITTEASKVDSCHKRNLTPMDFTFLRPMTTIAESETERSSRAANEDDTDSKSETSRYSADLTNKIRKSQASGVDDDDGTFLGFACEEAVPQPLKVPKQRSPLPDVPVLKVSRSSKLLQFENTPFSPRRDSSFMRGIQEASRLKEAQMDSHPALRCISPKPKETAPSYGMSPRSPSSQPKLARVDSGIGMDYEDEGYGTGNIEEWQSACERRSQSSRNGSTTITSQRTSSILSRKLSGSTGRLSGDIDVQRLRKELDMGPLLLPTGPEALIHPNHPFTWAHEKIMCRTIHNDFAEQPRLPDMPSNSWINLKQMDSSYFDRRSTMQNEPKASQQCPKCGKHCCRFAALLESSTTSSKDLTVIAACIIAINRLSFLRSTHPNGIEEYDTFLDCAQCGQRICQNCSTRCSEKLCQSTFCLECGLVSDQCPVHNFF